LLRDAQEGARPQDDQVFAQATSTPRNAFAGGVLALQRSAGNAAVGTVLRQRRPALDPVRRPYAHFAMDVQRGGRGRFVPFRDGELVVGDRLVVRATVHALRDPGKSVTARLLACYAGLAVEQQGWQGRSYVWTLRAVAPSKEGFRLALSLSGGVQQLFEQKILVASNVAAQRRRVSLARRLLKARFSLAMARLHEANRAFNYAYNEHKAELAQAKAREELDQGLVVRILRFGVSAVPAGPAPIVAKALVGERAAGSIGGTAVTYAGAGFVMGGVADIVDLMASYYPSSGSAGAPTGEGITEPGKGSVEHASRMHSRPGYTTAGDATFGTRAPILTDPLTFHDNLMAVLERVKRRLSSELEAVAASVRAEAQRSSRVLFHEDPVALAYRTDPLAERLETIEIDPMVYYEALWGAWVRVFYYSVELRGSSIFELGPSYMVRYELRTPGRRIDAALDTVVKRLGKAEYPDRQAFLDRYGDRASKEKQVSR
jgi:hypothetical protein